MTIRPNPMTPVTWLTTAGASELTPQDDDFVAETEDGYLLRVEQMDKNSWWWQVYGPAKEELVPDVHFMNTMDDAFIAA